MNELKMSPECGKARMLSRRSLTGVVVAVLLAGCAATDSKPLACPQAQARFLSCANGVQLVTYEASFELPQFCEPVQKIELQIRGFDRNRPLLTLAGGERVMLVGTAGWLVLPKEPGIVDTPTVAAAWWNNRACTLPSALR